MTSTQFVAKITETEDHALKCPRHCITTQWLVKMGVALDDRNEDYDHLTIEDIAPNPFHMIHFLFPHQLIVQGYIQEKKRMEGIASRCSHLHPQFQNDPQQLASFVMNVLYMPIMDTPSADANYYKLNDEVGAQFDDVFDSIGSGICEICAHYLSIEMIPFLRIMRLKYFKPRHRHYWDLVSCIFMILLQHPSTARFYLKHKEIRQEAMLAFGALCSKQYASTLEEHEHSTHDTCIALFAHQILRNGILMRKAKHWELVMPYVLASIVPRMRAQLKRTRKHDFTNACLMDMMWMVEIYLYYLLRAKSPQKPALRAFFDNLTLLGEELNAKSIPQCDAYHELMVNEFIAHLLGIVVDNENMWVVRIQQTVWKMKKNNETCLWRECRIRAKDQTGIWKLRKCRSCRIARYCSRKCQKLDWNKGHHRRLCQKFSRL